VYWVPGHKNLFPSLYDNANGAIKGLWKYLEVSNHFDAFDWSTPQSLETCFPKKDSSAAMKPFRSLSPVPVSKSSVSPTHFKTFRTCFENVLDFPSRPLLAQRDDRGLESSDTSTFTLPLDEVLAFGNNKIYLSLLP